MMVAKRKKKTDRGRNWSARDDYFYSTKLWLLMIWLARTTKLETPQKLLRL
jgi:hypothetical protein